MEELYVFGTGNAQAVRCYNTCFAIKSKEEFFMVDAGGGNGILGILEDMKVDLKRIHHIFVTHEHTDHILGVIWIIRMAAAAMKKGIYEGELRIYCHDGLTDTISTLCRLTLQKKFCDMIGSRILLIPVEDGQNMFICGHEITFFDIHSAKARQFGFRARLAGGTILAFTGDEPFHPLCLPYVEHSDFLLHEAFCLYRDREIFSPYEKHHSTVREACQLAQELHIPNLVLWHTEDKQIKQRKALYTAERQDYYFGRLIVPDDREILSLQAGSDEK